MSVRARQSVLRERRQYNKLAASQTLEDFALRYTPVTARRWSTFRVASAAVGATSFLACEAIGGGITLAYGVSNAWAAIAAATVLMFLVGLPIAYYAARDGLDVDLLTRGAGFGYLGSTITSLIYASFTFLLFAIEASIMSVALELVLGVPLWIAHMISSLVVIPIAIYGMRLISRMQMITQPVWVVLQLAPIVFMLIYGREELSDWSRFTGQTGAPDGAVDLVLFGLALSTLLSLLPQIGEQADYLRFMPRKTPGKALGWWAAMLVSGPGWVLIGAVKLMLGSFLVVFALNAGVGAEDAVNPAYMFLVVFREMLGSPAGALTATGILVVVCQLKINVTNAYAGSIAWSNFFSRLTHAHPGRVVWLVFNVLLALVLMQLGIFRVIEGILILFANLAAGWIGALSADLIISKPLKLSPSQVEFKRAHLYDINPVGVGAMALSMLVSTLCLVGAFGPVTQAFAPLLGLTVAFVSAPALALATRSRFYLAREPNDLPLQPAHVCVVCENSFERADMSSCPVYAGPICSLCCTLETRCHDACKTDSRVDEQLVGLLRKVLPPPVAALMQTTMARFLGVMAVFNLIIGAILYGIYLQYGFSGRLVAEEVKLTLWSVFFCLLLASGVAAWLLVLANESRRAAETEMLRQNVLLTEEIEAHERTDAELQRAKEAAEAANAAKSRYLQGVSHEIRSPLNAIYGYAQLLDRDRGVSSQDAARVIRRSSEHLLNLVEGLLDIARIENGVLRLSRDKVPFAEFLNQIVDMFRVQAEAKGLEFRFDYVGRVPAFVYADQKRLRQVLINLLSNAVKYTEQGHARLTVRYRGPSVEFEVADSGIGIPDEDRERIFEPFERGGSADGRIAPGTGLGLAISRVLAQIMGGEIAVTSAVGVGSTFTLRMVLPEPMGVTAEAPPPARIGGYAGRRRTVLLVDDDPSHLEILQRLLKPLGFQTFTASDGETAANLARAVEPDLAMLDIQMPGENGWQVAARLRALPHGRRLKIMMVSANAHEHSPGGDGKSPHDAFVMKPWEMHILLEKVRELLDLTWIEDAAPAPERADASVTAPPSAEPFIESLIQLASIGHVRAIEARLLDMEEADAANGPFVERLRQLVKRLDLKSFQKALRPKETHHG
ncbi:MAG: hybrid sensor histidine kinase/response regulator [Phenylobacterium zucineum]|nr:MAG: hybrid sensor histidine kinase/response regulator [Phenylobacterium zucineum]